MQVECLVQCLAGSDWEVLAISILTMIVVILREDRTPWENMSESSMSGTWASNH